MSFRWSKKKRKGTLITTFGDDKNDDEFDMEDEDGNENDEDIEQIEQIAKALVADCQINDRVVVMYFGKWYPGIVQNVRLLF